MATNQVQTTNPMHSIYIVSTLITQPVNTALYRSRHGRFIAARSSQKSSTQSAGLLSLKTTMKLQQ